MLYAAWITSYPGKLKKIHYVCVLALFTIVFLTIWDILGVRPETNYYTTMHALGVTLTLLGGIFVFVDLKVINKSSAVSASSAVVGQQEAENPAFQSTTDVPVEIPEQNGAAENEPSPDY